MVGHFGEENINPLPNFIIIEGTKLYTVNYNCSTSIFTQEAAFFTKTAVITFGGAYAVLAYISQQAVQYFQWVKPGEMLDGLGMAETLPGPLIKILEFVGFMAAYRHPGSLNPIFAGLLGAIITSWMTFTPAFL